MTDLELYEEMARLARRGEPFVLSTVIEHGGSSPRKSGAKMLVRADGSSLGTVGGGRIEQDTLAAARAALCDGQPRTLAFTLTEENGYACGGSMSIFVEPQGRRPLQEVRQLMTTARERDLTAIMGMICHSVLIALTVIASILLRIWVSAQILIIIGLKLIKTVVESPQL